MKEFRVRFTPSGKSIKAPAGTDLVTAAIKAGVMITASCGGEGLCGKCKVTIAGQEVLACQTILESDLEVRVPEGSIEEPARLSRESEDFIKGVISGAELRMKREPILEKIHVKFDPPTANDNTDDLDRIIEAVKDKIGPMRVSTKLGNIKHLSEVIRDSDFEVTAVLWRTDDGAEILALEPGNTADKAFGFAFDIGTTTVAAQLLDLSRGAIVGTRIVFNAQSSYGSDVITRIIYGSDPNGLLTLSRAVLGNINGMISELSGEYGVNRADIYAAVISGNMTMMHLLLKVDPSGIRKAPYVPAAAHFDPIHAGEIGIDINPKGMAFFFPGVSTYVGGDTIAGLIACGLPDSEDISLLIDIGTNGEIVLGNSEWMIGAAASAGPAFEGSGLSCGMKAVNGAVQKVEISKDLIVKVGVIGHEKPKGICGSGYIDILCQMLKAGVIKKDGKIDLFVKTSRIRKDKFGVAEFVIVPKTETSTGNDIVISEDDIENLKRSKGAIYSAIAALLNKVGKSVKDIKKIFIAGGFGSYLNIENSVFIGLLPDTDRSVYEFIGNSSLAGSRMAMLSRGILRKADSVRKNVTYLDLSGEPGYMDEYVAALFFPHTDLGRFPSVRS